MEKGKGCCRHSPTLKDDQIKNILGEKVCDGVYDEDVVRKRVKRVDVYEKQIIIAYVREMNIVYVNCCRVKSISKTVEIQTKNAAYIPIFYRKDGRLSNTLFCVF